MSAKLAAFPVPHKEPSVPLPLLRQAALWALVPVLLAYADTPFRTFRQRFVTVRWAERMLLFSIELNLLLLWTLTTVFLQRDAALAPTSIVATTTALGVVLAWLGAGLAVAARLALGVWFSGTFGIKPSHALVTTGPYALVRHPMYLGLLLLLGGLAIAHDSAVSLGFVVLLVVPFAMHTVIEEQMFKSHFGDAWTAYAGRVPRLVPGWPTRAAKPTA
jgi:protein-S-isoprenylcysteine O-methyltransferase Ste14